MSSVTTTILVPTTESFVETVTQSAGTSVETSTLLNTVTEGGETVTLPGVTQPGLPGATITTTEAW